MVLCQPSRIGHFRVPFASVKTTPQARPFIRKFVPPTASLSYKLKSFAYEGFCTKTRFETEGKGNWEMLIVYIEFRVSH